VAERAGNDGLERFQNSPALLCWSEWRFLKENATWP
jgi:hypothetical protein